MDANQDVLRVYETGRLTVVGFADRANLDHVDIVECREEIAELVRSHKCEVLAFDLTGVKLIPSGMLGLLASLRNLGVEVHLYNPSDDVREVLEITRLNQVLHLHQIEL